MSRTFDEQIKQLKQAIAEMERQRSILGDAAVDASLVPFHQKLAELEAQAGPPQEELPEIPTRQRKLATILFMDVVGSTEMTHDMDPEDQMALVDPLIVRLAEKVSEFGGHVARFTGDGFKAVFGLPVARENDPEQAIRAGLAIQAEASEIESELVSEHDIKEFKVRMGITTGLIFAGGETEGGDTIKGNPVNLAARLQSAAPPGCLLISHNTYRHVRGVFTVEPQEPISAKGFPEPVLVYLVKEIKPRAFRVQTRGVEGIETRMVGRETELKLLQDTLLTAIEEGEGGVITITGEAGVGKSRLLYEFQNWIELLPPPDVRFFQGRGKQEAQGQPYSLLRDVFAFRFQILDDDTGEGVRHKIEIGFGEVFGNQRDGMLRTHIIGQLLGFDFSASPHLKGVLNDPEQLRNRGLMYLFQYFQALSQVSPVVIFLEDIHWGDDSSLDAVDYLGVRIPQHRLLIVCATRPTLFERRPYWGEGKTYHRRLELHPLSKRESRHLVIEILKLAGEIPTELRELVVAGSEGNPFYMEELIKMLIEDGVIIPDEEIWQIDLTRLEQIDVPSTLAGVLQARLDSLPINERTVLQQASVVGRLFWDSIVTYIQAEAGNGDDPQLIPLALVSLRSRELVYRHEESAFVGAVEYLFKHDVLREVTYESVLKQLRRTYHGLVADWLIVNSGDRISEYSGLIAEHLLLAGRKDQSCSYFNMAGQSALASYASSEAERYYQHALDLSPPEPLLANVLAGLGEALYRQGNIDEATQIWQRSIDLYKELKDYDNLGDIFARLSRLIWISGDYLKAWELCQEGLGELEGAPDSQGYARLLAEAGRTAYFLMEIDQFMQLCQEAVDMAEGLDDLEVWADASTSLGLLVPERYDVIKTLGILEDVVALTEAEGLLRSAARAHHNLGYQLNWSNFDLKRMLFHNLRAAEIYKQIGDVEMMMLSLQNFVGSYIESGELISLEDELTEFLQGFTAGDPMVRVLLQTSHPVLSHARGEWLRALEQSRENLKKARDIGNLQEISDNNLDLADSLLELNRFTELDDLSEGESALIENNERKLRPIRTHYLLAVVCARQRRFSQADSWLESANDFIGKHETDFSKSRNLSVDFELAFAKENWAEAVVACEKSIKLYRNSGICWMWARKLIDLGDALVGRDGPSDLDRARETFQQSLYMFTEMGAPGYIKVLEERLLDIGD